MAIRTRARLDNYQVCTTGTRMSSCRGKPIASFCAIIDADHGCGAPPGLTLACVSIGPQAGSEEKGHADRASKDRGLSAGTAFAIVANVVDWPEIISSIKSIEVLTPGPIRAGTRLREDRIMFGRDLTQELEIDYAFWPIIQTCTTNSIM
jgi:hypothetical protein